MCKNQLFAEVSRSLQYLSASQTALPRKTRKTTRSPVPAWCARAKIGGVGPLPHGLAQGLHKNHGIAAKNGISWDQMGFKYMGLIWNLCRIFLLWRSSEGHIRKDWSLMCKNYHLNIYICVCVCKYTHIYIWSAKPKHKSKLHRLTLQGSFNVLERLPPSVSCPLQTWQLNLLPCRWYMVWVRCKALCSWLPGHVLAPLGIHSLIAFSRTHCKKSLCK